MKKLAFAALLGLAAACTTTEERIGGAAVGTGVGAAAGPAVADTLQTNTRRARRR